MSDWSILGTRFILYQVVCECTKSQTLEEKMYKPGCCETGWELVMAGGCYNTDCKANYSPIKGELLRIANALHKSRYLTYGSDKLMVVTDHRPLVGFLEFEYV
jgi:hypothetical protein